MDCLLLVIGSKHNLAKAFPVKTVNILKSLEISVYHQWVSTVNTTLVHGWDPLALKIFVKKFHMNMNCISQTLTESITGFIRSVVYFLHEAQNFNENYDQIFGNNAKYIDEGNGSLRFPL